MHLPLLHQGVPHAVGLAAELDEPATVDYAVDDGGRHLVVAKDRALPAELEVRRDHHRLGLVGVGEDLEDQPGAVGVQRQEPELVDDEQAGVADLRGLPSSRPSSRVLLSLETRAEAVKKRASSLLSHTSAHSAEAMCVFPVLTSPMSTRSSRRPRKPRESRSSRPIPSGHETADQS